MTPLKFTQNAVIKKVKHRLNRRTLFSSYVSTITYRSSPLICCLRRNLMNHSSTVRLVFFRHIIVVLLFLLFLLLLLFVSSNCLGRQIRAEIKVIKRTQHTHSTSYICIDSMEMSELLLLNIKSNIFWIML